MTDDKRKQFAKSFLARCMEAKRLKRPPQPEYLPAGLITLYQAFLEIGHGLFGEAWKGTELDSISSTDVEKITTRLNDLEKVRLQREEAQRTLPDVTFKKIGYEGAADDVRIMIPKPDIDASKRRDAAWTKMRDWFYAGTVPTYIYPDRGGDLIPIKHKSWGRDQDYERFNQGRLSLSDRFGGGGWLVVKEDELAEALMFGAEASVPLSESAEPSVEEKQPTSETADAENEEPTPPDNVRPKRNHDVGEDAILRNSIESVIAAAKTKWGDGKKQSFRGMSEVLVKGKPGDKFMGLGESAIRQILAGRYKPAKRLGISGL